MVDLPDTNTKYWDITLYQASFGPSFVVWVVCRWASLIEGCGLHNLQTMDTSTSNTLSAVILTQRTLNLTWSIIM